MNEAFLASECVSCGACVQACPTATLTEKSVHRDRPAGAFGGHHLRLLRRRLHLQGRDAGEEVVRMVPYKDGKANRGHSCVKGRFAWGYATHKDRILKPMIREQDHRSLARSVAGRRRSATPPPSSAASRPSTAATRSAASPPRAAPTRRPTWCRSWCARGFGNNNVDTCARVCHSPTGYGLKPTFGTSAGTQDFDSVENDRRHDGHRRQPDRRPSGLRLAA